jgi:hypothetical protein
LVELLRPGLESVAGRETDSHRYEGVCRAGTSAELDDAHCDSSLASSQVLYAVLAKGLMLEHTHRLKIPE